MKIKYQCLVALSMTFGTITAQQVDLEGHRGARGLAPENSIPGFLLAVDLGVTTLEMDVVISRDNQVVVSHEAYFSSTICLDQEGQEIKSSIQKDLKIYEMDYATIQSYDCGSKPHKDFPEQVNQSTVKPLLSDAIKAIERHIKSTTKYLVKYNIEIKSFESGDEIFHPKVPEFSALVYDVIDKYLDLDRIIIQSFDFRVLRYWHEHYPEIKLGAVIGNTKGIEKNLEKLGFTPDIYIAHFSLINKEKIEQLHDMEINVVPWTVNEVNKMQKLIENGVDGLITDYPNRAKEIGLGVNIPYGQK